MSFYVKMPEMWRQVLAARPATVADYKIALELLNARQILAGGEIHERARGQAGHQPANQMAVP